MKFYLARFTMVKMPYMEDSSVIGDDMRIVIADDITDASRKVRAALEVDVPYDVSYSIKNLVVTEAIQ